MHFCRLTKYGGAIITCDDASSSTCSVCHFLYVHDIRGDDDALTYKGFGCGKFRRLISEHRHNASRGQITTFTPMED